MWRIIQYNNYCGGSFASGGGGILQLGSSNPTHHVMGKYYYFCKIFPLNAT